MTIPKHIMLFGIAFVVLLISWRTTVSHMAGIVWSVDVFSHGLLVPLVSAALIWSRRSIIATLTPAFSLLGASVVLSASILWLLGQLLDVALFSHIALVAAVNGLVLALLGLSVYRAILFPMLFLFLAVPFGHELVGPLQTMTANLVIGMLDLFGAAYKADGVLIELSSGFYEVAEACAGVKFLFTSIVTGILLAHLVFNSWRRRIFILIISAVLPIAANALRVLSILAIAEMTDQSFAKDVDHLVYGWVFLSIVLFALIALAYKISDKPAGTASPGFMEQRVPAGSGSILVGIASAMFPVLAVIVMPSSSPQEYSENSIQVVSLFDAAPANYRMLNGRPSISTPRFVGADNVRMSTLRRGGHVFLVSYARISNLSSGRRLFQPGIRTAGPLWVEMRGLVSRDTQICNIAFKERILRNDARRMVTWAFYFVNGKAVTSGLHEKAVTALERMSREPTVGEIFVLSAPVDGDIEAIREVFTDFMSTFLSDGLLWVLGGTKVRNSITCAG